MKLDLTKLSFSNQEGGRTSETNLNCLILLNMILLTKLRTLPTFSLAAQKFCINQIFFLLFTALKAVNQKFDADVNFEKVFTIKSINYLVTAD